MFLGGHRDGLPQTQQVPPASSSVSHTGVATSTSGLEQLVLHLPVGRQTPQTRRLPHLGPPRHRQARVRVEQQVLLFNADRRHRPPYAPPDCRARS